MQKTGERESESREWEVEIKNVVHNPFHHHHLRAFHLRDCLFVRVSVKAVCMSSIRRMIVLSNDGSEYFRLKKQEWRNGAKKKANTADVFRFRPLNYPSQNLNIDESLKDNKRSLLISG